MSSNNLYKSGFINFNQEEVRVIDSNQKIAEKLSALLESEETVSYQDSVQPFDPQDFEGLEEESGKVREDAAVSALFGEEIAQTPEADMQRSEEAGREALQQANNEAEQILEQARQQAEEILEDAQNQANIITQQAYGQAKEQGQQEGYQAGLIQARQEMKQKEKKLQQLEMELKERYDEQLSEMEPYLVEKLSGVYEYLIGVELSRYKNILMYMIDHTLHSTEAADSYLLHVSEQDFSYVTMQKSQLMESGGLGNATLDVVEDKTLTKNQCLIETENGIFDCSLSVQLEELKRKLMLLAYGQKGE